MPAMRTFSIPLFTIIIGIALTWSGDARAQCELDKFLGSGGERAVAGAIFQDGPGGLDNRGGVLVFQRNDAGTPEDNKDDFWEFHSNLVHNDPEAGDQLGFSVSISGHYIAAGAPVKGSTGAAYVFALSGKNWMQRTKLLPQAGTANEAWFGYSVSVAKGPTDEAPFVVVGAPQDNPNGHFNGGAAFVFRQHDTIPSVWPQDGPRIVPSDVAQSDRAGWSVAGSFANSTSRIVIGAPQESSSFGAAYVFRQLANGDWSQEQKLTGCTSTGGFNFGPAQFGYAVSIANSPTLNSEQIVVGAPFCNRGLFGGDPILDSGAAYVFALNGSTWESQRTLREVGGAVQNSDNFGRAVATSGDVILAGIYGDDGADGNAGAAIMFRRQGSSWSDNPADFRLDVSDAAGGARLGQSVGLDGVHGLVGAHLDSSQAGAAYLFGVGPDSDDDTLSDICDNCPNHSNLDQLDNDGDETGDPCDNCPDHFNADQADDDEDGIGDECDSCPSIADGPMLSTCTAGAITICETDEECDTAMGSLDGRCSIPLGICVEGLVFDCSLDTDCDSAPGAEDGICLPSEGDQDADGIGELCDNCPEDWNPNQADFNDNGLGDACDAIWNIADELVPPLGPVYESAVPAAYEDAVLLSSLDSAVYYPYVYCTLGTPKNCMEWEGRWFANEPGTVTIQWRDMNDQPVGDPVSYVVTESVGEPPQDASYDVESVRFLRDWAQVGNGAPVNIDTNFTLTIQYNSTFVFNNPPVTPSDIYVISDAVQTSTTKTGQIVFRYTDGPDGRLVGFEVVSVQNFGTPSGTMVEVGRQLAVPDGADCKAHFVTNAQQSGFPAGWQRVEAPLEVWPIRPEASASNFVVAWYEQTAFTGNCWHNAIRRYVANWPSDPQPFVVDSDGVADPSITQLPVGETDVYCSATVMYPSQFTSPRALIGSGNQFSASEPGHAVVRFDTRDDQPGASCTTNRTAVHFDVIRAFDRLSPYNDMTGEGVFEGQSNAPIGTQILHPQHNSETPVFPFGYRYSGQPFAEAIYNETGQIFPVNTSDVHGLLEVWWFEESQYAPQVSWPFRVGHYDAVWPTIGMQDDPIVIASRSGAGAYPPGAEIYHLGTPGGSESLNGWNPNDEHSILLPIGGDLRAFAVRDDNPWNVTSGHPYTIVQYPEQRCAGPAENLCLSEGDCGVSESCDATGRYRMGVHEVIAVQSPFFFDYSEGSLSTAIVPIEDTELGDYLDCWNISTAGVVVGLGDRNEDGITTQACSRKPRRSRLRESWSTKASLITSFEKSGSRRKQENVRNRACLGFSIRLTQAEYLTGAVETSRSDFSTIVCRRSWRRFRRLHGTRRTISWLHQHKRLRIRYDRRADIHEAFMSLACSAICWKMLKHEFF